MIHLLATGLGIGLAVLGHAPLDESAEPPLQYTLTIGEVKQAITLGEPAELRGDFNNPVVTLTASPTRTFPYNGLSFKYPAHFTWEADVSNPLSRTWTMEHQDGSVMVVGTLFEISPQKFAEGVAGNLGARDPKIGKIADTFGGIELQGVRLEADIARLHHVTEVFRIPTRLGGRLLVIQSFLEDGEPGPRSAELAKLIRESFAINDAPTPARGDTPPKP